jgi:tetratricopeptide (TPR) repeat protein
MIGQMFTSDGVDATAQGPSSIEDTRAHQHLQRAYAHADAGELEDALRECDRAIEMVPQWAEAHNLRGVVLDEMGRVEEAIAAYEEAVRLDAGFEEAVENLAEAREERRGGRPRWERVVALVVSFVLLIMATVVVGVLEAQRGPDWQLELDEYIAQSASPSESVTIQSVVEASEPWNFSGEMGRAVRYDWRWGSVDPSFPPEAVQCVLLERIRPSTVGGEEETIHQVAFVAYHTDALYQVGWLAYAGPEEPFTQEFVAHLATIGCDLGLE